MSIKLGRNESCHCGSGKKYKKCCLDNDLKNKYKDVENDFALGQQLIKEYEAKQKFTNNSTFDVL